MAELKPFEVIMKIDFGANDGVTVVAHAEKVAELVRCKDCKHRPMLENPIGKRYGFNVIAPEDKDGNTIGCYIDRNFILKRDAEYEAELERRVQYFLEKEEQNGKDYDNLL